MTPYTTILQSKHLIAQKEDEGGLNDFTAERIFREFKRVEQGIRSLNDRIDNIKTLKTVHQALRTGIVAAASTNTVEPFNFGDPGVVLEQFTLINADLAREGGKIISLKLSGNGGLRGSTAATTANAKILFQLAGSSFVRFSGTGTVTGTTSRNFFVELDLMQLEQEFQNGNFFFGVGLWKTAGAGQIFLGESTESHPNVYVEIVYQVELP